MRITLRTVFVALALCTVAACGSGGDNDLALCQGCTTRTPTPSAASVTPTGPTPVVTATP